MILNQSGCISSKSIRKITVKQRKKGWSMFSKGSALGSPSYQYFVTAPSSSKIDHDFVKIACSRKLLRASKNENLVIKAQENSSIDLGNSIARNIYTEY